MKVRLEPTPDQLVAKDDFWLTLGALRELVKQADANAWGDKALVSNSTGGEHPTLRGMWCTTHLVVEDPA